MSQIDINPNIVQSTAPDPPTPPTPPTPPKPKKTIQVPVVKGKGEKQHLVVEEFTILPPNPPIFRIVDVDKKVVITDTKLLPSVKYDSREEPGGADWWSKVIINGYIDKNVSYKTISDCTSENVNGPLFHFTTRVYFATYLEIKSEEQLYDTDKVEILSAVVEGEKEELLDPVPVPKCAPEWAVTYKKLLEKILIRITAKVTRTEEIKISAD